MKFSSLLLLVLMFCFSCTKIQTTDIGTGLIPPVDGVNTKDTLLEVVTKNTGVDTAYIQITQDHVVGYLNDANLFGTTTAAINFEVRADSYPFHFENVKSKLHLDSVVLLLHYTGTTGDSTQNTALRVFEINHSSKMPHSYYTFSDTLFPNTYKVTASNLLSEAAPTNAKASTIDDTASLIHIRLSPAFGQRLLNYDSSANQPYHNDSLFKEAFAGFHIAADRTGNSLLHISLSDTATKLALYYKYDSATTTKQVASVKYFRTDPTTYTTAHSNEITREHTGQVANYFPADKPSANVNDSLLFIDANPGIYATIKIPGLSGVKNSLIHRAELLCEQATDNSDQYFLPPANLFLAAYSSDSMRRFAIPNTADFSSGYISNIFDFGVVAKKMNGNSYYTYSFNISRYVQGVVTNHDSTYPLVLWAPFNYYILPVNAPATRYPLYSTTLNSIAGGRVRLFGGGAPTSLHRMRLHIIYSDLHK